MSANEVTDAVLLIPGFLAFDRLGKHSYFADTVTKAITAGLEEEAPPSLVFEVVSITVPSVDTLARRQLALLAAMEEVSQRHPQARLHLVGHSTGGLDAELLARVTPVDDETWSESADAVRTRLHSITTIAAPLRGTTLATAALAELLSSSWTSVGATAWSLLRERKLDDAGKQARDLARAALSLPADPAFRNVLQGSLKEKRALLKFLHSVLRRHGLIGDLRPDSVEQKMQTREDPRLAGVRRTRFLTIAPPSSKPTTAARLFDALYGATREQAQGIEAPSFVSEIKARVAAGAITSVGDREMLQGLVSSLAPGDNDGIVNTLRQLHVRRGESPSAELERVVAIVLADHLDVVGYYPNNQIAAKEPPAGLRRDGSEQNGFLESSAHFRDPELAQLYKLVAAQIRNAVPTAELKLTKPQSAPPKIQIVQA